MPRVDLTNATEVESCGIFVTPWVDHYSDDSGYTAGVQIALSKYKNAFINLRAESDSDKGRSDGVSTAELQRLAALFRTDEGLAALQDAVAKALDHAGKRQRLEAGRVVPGSVMSERKKNSAARKAAKNGEADKTSKISAVNLFATARQQVEEAEASEAEAEEQHIPL